MAEIIKFESNNCNNCKALQGFLNQFDVDIRKVNVLDSPEIAAEYNVMSIPMMIFIDDDGNEVNRVVGFNSTRAAEIKASIKGLGV